MALTKERLRTTAPTTAKELSKRTSYSLMGAWVAVLAVIEILEPRTAEAIPLWGWIAAYAQLGTIVAAFVGLTRRARYGVTATLLGSLLLLGGVFACPATGHHAFGLWWMGEFAASLAFVGVSANAYFRRS